MEAQRALESCDQPPAIHYLSVHCDILALVLSSGSKEVTKVPLRCFLQHVGSLASWLTVASRACVAMRSLKKQWPRYCMTLIVMELVLYGLRFSSRKSVGGTTLSTARPGRLPHSRSPSASNQAHPPPLNRWELVSYVIWSPKTKNEAGCYQNSITSHFNRLARLSQPLLSAIL